MSKYKHLNKHETEILILSSERTNINLLRDQRLYSSHIRDISEGNSWWEDYPIFTKYMCDKWGGKSGRTGKSRKKQSKDNNSSLLGLGAVSSLATLLPQPGNMVGYTISSEESSSSESLPLELTPAVMMLNLPWSPNPQGLLLVALQLSCLPCSQPYNCRENLQPCASQGP